jgi:CubicO group peptidase (beta-lactamase class C family)
MTRKILLGCGVLSSLLYVFMNVIVPMQYDGYRAASQTVSELSAIGAPTRALWVRLGIAYSLLVLAFGAGVRWSAGRSRPLRRAGTVLTASGLVGLAWPPMHARGAVPTLTDTLHIAFTIVMLGCFIAAIVFGSDAFGRRFRWYSLATLVVLVAFGVVTGLESPRLAANEPTPWIGVWERINIAAYMLWVMVFAIALLRTPAAAAHARRATAETAVHGSVRPGFEAVREAFAENFARRRELGGACCVYRNGEKVVDLWGGIRNEATGERWEEDTMVLVHSATKGLAAMTLAIAHARGWLDYRERVCTYWPEFAQAGKEKVTVRQLLAHQAGLHAFGYQLDKAVFADRDRLAVLLARARPAWAPGTRQAYHAISLGFFESELLRRVDPQHRSLGQFFQDEIATPLGLDFYICLPHSIPNSRLAVLRPGTLLTSLAQFPLPLMWAAIHPRSAIYRGLIGNPAAALPVDAERVYARELEVPSGGGVGTARAMARAYGVFAAGGRELGLRPETLRALSAPATPSEHGFYDEAVKGEVQFSLGFMKPCPSWPIGRPDAFGAPGAGGSLGFAEPSTGIGYAYVTNRMGAMIAEDPRERALREALRGCAAALPPRRASAA